jgi:hypothetical protein
LRERPLEERKAALDELIGCGVGLQFRFRSRLCENSKVQFARRNSVSISVDFKTNSVGNHRQERGTEKTILRILGSCTFSHSLGQNAEVVVRNLRRAINEPQHICRRHLCRGSD